MFWQIKFEKTPLTDKNVIINDLFFIYVYHFRKFLSIPEHEKRLFFYKPNKLLYIKIRLFLFTRHDNMECRRYSLAVSIKWKIHFLKHKTFMFVSRNWIFYYKRNLFVLRLCTAWMKHPIYFQMITDYLVNYFLVFIVCTIWGVYKNKRVINYVVCTLLFCISLE